MSPPSPPPTPDPYKTAAAQQMANVEVAVANTVLANADEVTPQGTISFEELPELYPTNTYDADGNVTGTRNIKRWRKTVSLTPSAQAIFDQQQAISLAMNTAAQTQAELLVSRWQNPFTLDQLPAYSATPSLSTLASEIPVPRVQIREIGQNDDIIREKDNVRKAIADRLAWQRESDREARMVRLSNMGIYPGMEAFEREMRVFDRKAADELLQVEQAAGVEHARLVEISKTKAEFFNKTVLTDFQLAVTRLETENRVKLQSFDAAQAVASFVNSVRAMAMQEYLTERSQTVNEISSLMHGGQVQIPKGEAFKSQRIADTPVGEYVYRSAAMDMQKWQMEVQSQQSMMGGIMGLMGNLMSLPMMSDRRVKTDIEHVSDDPRGFGWYLWRYVWDEPGTKRFGVMAQEVAEVLPEAVTVLPSGVMAVYYGRLA